MTPISFCRFFGWHHGAQTLHSLAARRPSHGTRLRYYVAVLMVRGCPWSSSLLCFTSMSKVSCRSEDILRKSSPQCSYYHGSMQAATHYTPENVLLVRKLSWSCPDAAHPHFWESYRDDCRCTTGITSERRCLTWLSAVRPNASSWWQMLQQLPKA